MISLNIKTSTQPAFKLEIDPSLTILDLKLEIEAKLQVLPENQRLIFAGKVLKDVDTVAFCKLADGLTVHLVKSVKKSLEAQSPQANTTPITTQVVEPVVNSAQTLNPMQNMFNQNIPNQQGGNPLQNMFGGGMGNMGPPMGMDPAVMSQMMANPAFSQMMAQMMSNPEIMQQAMAQSGQQMNPRMMQMMNSPAFR